MQIRVALPVATAQALAEMAVAEHRDARDQATVLLIRALSRRGLVSRDGLARKQQLEAAPA